MNSPKVKSLYHYYYYHFYIAALVFLFERARTFKVVIITNLGQRQKSAQNAENKTDLPETLQVPSLCCFS